MIFSSGKSTNAITHAVRRNFGGLLGANDPLKTFHDELQIYPVSAPGFRCMNVSDIVIYFPKVSQSCCFLFVCFVLFLFFLG